MWRSGGAGDVAGFGVAGAGGASHGINRLSTLDRKLESWKVGYMKTTLDLPAELVREMKLRAADEGRKLRDVATEVVRRGLMQPSSLDASTRHRVKLPLIECGKPKPPAKQMTAEQVADVLLKQEMEWSDEAAGR
jgi:hypothetical protein